MRWNNLFDDLESQLESELGAEEVDLKAEEERLRVGRLSLRSRLLSIHEASGGREYSLRFTVGTEALRIAPASFGKDWMSGGLIDETPRRIQVIVPFRSVGGVVLDRAQTMASIAAQQGLAAGRLADRLGITFVLRDLSRRRCAVDMVTAAGRFHGTLDRVGRDHCDLAIHEAGQPRRESAVVQYRIIPIDQLLYVRL
jgi:hypothetical protein